MTFRDDAQQAAPDGASAAATAAPPKSGDASRWGATPTEWERARKAVGVAHLLAVVANPAAAISPKSGMKSLGKIPSLYNRNREVVGITKWVQKHTLAEEAAGWARESDYGICIQAREIRALDIDIKDPELAQRVEHRFRAALGEVGAILPRRSRPGTGKCLLAFRLRGADVGPLSKRSFRVGDELVEFLGDGQQFVACGTHKDGMRYEWDGGFPDRFIELSPDQFEQAWAAIVDEFATAPAVKGGVRQRGPNLEGVSDPVAQWIVATGRTLGKGPNGVLYIACPWHDEHSCDSGISQTVWLPAGTNGYERGHFRCLHAHCAERNAADYLAAEHYYAQDFEVLPPLDAALPPTGLERDRAGRILATLDSVMRAIETPQWTGFEFAYDDFYGAVVRAPVGGIDWRPLQEDDYVTLRRWLEQHGFKPVGRELMRDAMLGVVMQRRIDSAKSWLEALEWDGIARIEQMLPRYFGTSDTPYTRAVGCYWMTAHAARIMQPGCQADMVPVMVGPQNAGKSSACAALAPFADSYAKIDLNEKDADLSRRMRGKLLGELDELRGFQGRTAEANKAWITQRFEEWTPKYQEFATKLQRRLILVGTSNADDFLDDATGERRWLPFRVGDQIDHQALAADREQLWAEGRERWANNGIEWQAAYQLAQAEHAGFKRQDVWAEAVNEWVERWTREGKSVEKVPLRTIFFEVLGLDIAKVGRAQQNRLRDVLLECGFVQDRARVGGRRPRVWTKGTDADRVAVVPANA